MSMGIMVEKEQISYEDILKGISLVEEYSEKSWCVPNISFDKITFDPKKKLTFEQLILGYYIARDYKEGYIKGWEYYEDKVKTEHTKWIKILYCLFINPENLKRRDRYQFNKRKSDFVLDMLSEFSKNREFKKIRYSKMIN